MTTEPTPEPAPAPVPTPAPSRPDKLCIRWHDPAHWIAFGFGTGLSPRAPGTVASAAAALFHLWLLAPLPWMAQTVVIVAAFALGVFVCSRVEREMATHDHGALVWDEFVGVWLTLLVCGGTWLGTLVGFGLFRAFDIWKPWPISWLDRQVGGGLGVMLDDVAAGLFGAVAAAGLLYLLGASL